MGTDLKNFKRRKKERKGSKKVKTLEEKEVMDHLEEEEISEKNEEEE